MLREQTTLVPDAFEGMKRLSGLGVKDRRLGKWVKVHATKCVPGYDYLDSSPLATM